ncbi:unnamed protein product [Prorocentrum cordatum]|uniref:(d)CMP kinase n=1 Tax=Prorocentrum cordatum TaxID=2364126 RepID=A0ABN9UKY9_9DINO|nr:unnamed protein product [Polarella glacialis]
MCARQVGKTAESGAAWARAVDAMAAPADACPSDAAVCRSTSPGPYTEPQSGCSGGQVPVLVVGISGPSGSGKSTLASALAARLGAELVSEDPAHFVLPYAPYATRDEACEAPSNVNWAAAETALKCAISRAAAGAAASGCAGTVVVEHYLLVAEDNTTGELPGPAAQLLRVPGPAAAARGCAGARPRRRRTCGATTTGPSGRRSMRRRGAGTDGAGTAKQPDASNRGTRHDASRKVPWSARTSPTPRRAFSPLHRGTNHDMHKNSVIRLNFSDPGRTPLAAPPAPPLARSARREGGSSADPRNPRGPPSFYVCAPQSKGEEARRGVGGTRPGSLKEEAMQPGYGLRLRPSAPQCIFVPEIVR